MWTKEETASLVEQYVKLRDTGEYDVRGIHVEGKTRSSLINKLVKLKIYVVKPKPKVVTKKMLVRELNDILDGEFWSFDKVNKDELLLLVNKIKSRSDDVLL